MLSWILSNKTAFVNVNLISPPTTHQSTPISYLCATKNDNRTKKSFSYNNSPISEVKSTLSEPLSVSGLCSYLSSRCVTLADAGWMTMPSSARDVGCFHPHTYIILFIRSSALPIFPNLLTRIEVRLAKVGSMNVINDPLSNQNVFFEDFDSCLSATSLFMFALFANLFC